MKELEYLRDTTREKERSLYLLKAFQVIDKLKQGGLSRK